jgi:hypothetical protein
MHTRVATFPPPCRSPDVGTRIVFRCPERGAHGAAVQRPSYVTTSRVKALRPARLKPQPVRPHSLASPFHVCGSVTRPDRTCSKVVWKQDQITLHSKPVPRVVVRFDLVVDERSFRFDRPPIDCIADRLHRSSSITWPQPPQRIKASGLFPFGFSFGLPPLQRCATHLLGIAGLSRTCTGCTTLCAQDRHRSSNYLIAPQILPSRASRTIFAPIRVSASL